MQSHFSCSLLPASDSVPRLIEDVFCGEISRGRTYSEYDSLHEHLLRCDYDLVDQSSTPDHQDDFAVECSESFHADISQRQSIVHCV